MNEGGNDNELIYLVTLLCRASRGRADDLPHSHPAPPIVRSSKWRVAYSVAAPYVSSTWLIR